MKTKPLYLDNAATTSVDPRVKEAMLPYFDEIYGNASSNHVYGKEAKIAIERARGQVASIINSEPQEIYFTSGATEAINWALKGYLEANPNNGNHIITVKTEHKAVLNTCEYLETKGYEVTYLDVDSNGLISLDDLEASIKENTSMISVMYVNNEIGIIQDIPTIGQIARDNNICFFCDATQAVGKVLVNVIEDNIDMLCLSGHKFNGPKGVGALYIKSGLNLEPLIHGGGQESGMRGGTYNTPLIVGLGEACDIKMDSLETQQDVFYVQREEMIKAMSSLAIPLFTDIRKAPHILCLRLKELDAEDFLILRSKEFSASTGSACNSRIIEVSHVSKALGNNKHNVIRISF